MKTEETQNEGRRGKQPMKTVLLCLSVDDLAPGNSACNKSTPRHMKELLCQMSTWEYLKVAHYIFKQLVSVCNEIIFDFLTDWFVKNIYTFFLKYNFIHFWFGWNYLMLTFNAFDVCIRYSHVNWSVCMNSPAASLSRLTFVCHFRFPYWTCNMRVLCATHVSLCVRVCVWISE